MEKAADMVGFSWVVFCVAYLEGRASARQKEGAVVLWAAGGAEKAEKEVLAFFHWTARLKTHSALIVEICNIS